MRVWIAIVSQILAQIRKTRILPAMNPAPRIWFHPPKFWAATKGMSPEQADRFLDEVLVLAEVRDLEALRRFPFVSIGPHERATDLSLMRHSR